MSRKSIRLKRKIQVEKQPEQEEKNLEGVQVALSKAVSRELKHSILSIFLVVIVILSSSFAIFTSIQKSENYNSITVGILKVDFLQDTVNTLNLNGAYPVPDVNGLEAEGYSFKISNTGNLNAQYKIRIVDDTEMISEDECSSNQLDKSKIKVSINDGTPFLLDSKSSSDYVVELASIAPGNMKEYIIKIWIDENAGNEVLGKHYHGKIVVDSVNLSTPDETV